MGHVAHTNASQGAAQLARSLTLNNRFWFDVPHLLWWLLIVGGMCLLALYGANSWPNMRASLATSHFAPSLFLLDPIQVIRRTYLTKETHILDKRDPHI